MPKAPVNSQDTGQESISLDLDRRQEFEDEPSQHRQQLDAAATDVDEAHKRTLEARAMAHAREIVELRSAHARELEDRVWATKETLENSFKDRLADAQRDAEKNTASRLEEVHKRALEAAATTHACEIGELRSARARELEERITATKEELESAFVARLADAQREAEKTIEARLEEAHKDWHTNTEAKLVTAREQSKAEAAKKQAVATTEQLEREFAGRLADELRQAEEQATAELTSTREAWRAEESERLAAAKKEFDVELSKLRQQLDDASINFDEMRKQALDTATADHAQEIGALQKEHAGALKVQLEATEKTFERRFAERSAIELRQSEEKAKTELEKDRQAWELEAEANLAATQKNWRAEEAERLAAAFKVWQGNPQKTKDAKKVSRMPTLPLFRVPLRLPRSSLVIKGAIVGLLGLALLHPEVKSRLPAAKDLVAERSAVAASELRIYFDPLISKVTGSEPLPEAMSPQPDGASTEASVDSVERTTIGVGRANIRSGPSTSASVIETLARGSELIVLGSQGSWIQVSFGEGVGEVGWVHSDLLGDMLAADSTSRMLVN